VTDRINALTVVLKDDMRDDDIEHLVNAIKMFGNVLSVKANISELEDHIALERARSELEKKIWKALRGE